MDPCGKISHGFSSPFDCIIFDLDDTLYSSKTGIGEAIKRNIDDLLVEKFGFEESKASSLRIELFKTYGSSLAGLRALGYDITADDYHSFVHGRLPYDVIKPDLQLRNLLLSIKQHKIATRPDEIPVVLKPSPEAMKIALEVVNVDPRRTLFLDDSPRNIAAGKNVGLRTVLVGTAMKTMEADYAVETVTNIVKVIPEIWYSKEEEEEDEKMMSCVISEMDSALATTTVGA